MDAVLKHLGLRSDFIVCHPDVIDDLLFHAPRPLPTHPPTSSLATLYFSQVPPSHTHPTPPLLLHSVLFTGKFEH